MTVYVGAPLYFIDRKVAGSSPGRSRGRIFLLQGQLSVLTLISVSFLPLCCRSSTYKIQVILQQGQVVDYRQIHMHLTYAASNEMTL